MQPYFITHAVGKLYFPVLLIWYGLEFVQFLRQRQWRAGGRRIKKRSWRVYYGVSVIGSVAALAVVPGLAPAASIGRGGGAFAVGLAMLVIGVTLRAWSFHALGQYFIFTVKVSPDQPVVSNGPYRLLRHPGYAGGLLAMIGVAAVYGNWIGLATIAALWLAIIVWRIRIEENALLDAIGGDYRSYAVTHKRLVPLIW